MWPVISGAKGSKVRAAGGQRQGGWAGMRAWQDMRLPLGSLPSSAGGQLRRGSGAGGVTGAGGTTGTARPPTQLTQAGVLGSIENDLQHVFGGQPDGSDVRGGHPAAKHADGDLSWDPWVGPTCTCASWKGPRRQDASPASAWKGQPPPQKNSCPARERAGRGGGRQATRWGERNAHQQEVR